MLIYCARAHVLKLSIFNNIGLTSTYSVIQDNTAVVVNFRWSMANGEKSMMREILSMDDTRFATWKFYAEFLAALTGTVTNNYIQNI